MPDPKSEFTLTAAGGDQHITLPHPDSYPAGFKMEVNGFAFVEAPSGREREWCFDTPEGPKEMSFGVSQRCMGHPMKFIVRDIPWPFLMAWEWREKRENISLKMGDDHFERIDGVWKAWGKFDEGGLRAAQFFQWGVYPEAVVHLAKECCKALNLEFKNA